MSTDQFQNDPSRLPQNVTGWIELTEELRESFLFNHGSVWLMAVPVYDRCSLKSWDYELQVITVDCDGPLRLECNDSDWGWDWSDVAYMAPLRK
jgi:hypothetical protein